MNTLTNSILASSWSPDAEHTPSSTESVRSLVRMPNALEPRSSAKQRSGVVQDLEIGSPYRIPGLTPRESEIAVYVALGYSNPNISQMAGISPQTVKNHLTSIYRALRIKGREQLEPIVYDHVPEVRQEMLRLGRAPLSTSSLGGDAA